MPTRKKAKRKARKPRTPRGMPKPDPGRLPAVINFRVSNALLKALGDAAADAGVSGSEYVRRAILERLRAEGRRLPSD